MLSIKSNKHIIVTGIILIFHLIGFIGFILNPVYFKSLSPFNIMLSIGLVILMGQQTNLKFYGSLGLVAFFCFFIEVIGVKTEYIFGSYHYGNSLGYKIFSVPLLIGINWCVLLYSTNQLSSFKNPIINALFGACLMVFLDFFMEQNAAKFDFWYWKNGIIPLQNYIAWFLISFILNLMVQKHLTQKANYTAKAFYFIQIAFFLALYLFV